MVGSDTFYRHVTGNIWNLIDFESLTLVFATYVIRTIEWATTAGFSQGKSFGT